MSKKLSPFLKEQAYKDSDSPVDEQKKLYQYLESIYKKLPTDQYSLDKNSVFQKQFFILIANFRGRARALEIRNYSKMDKLIQKALHDGDALFFSENELERSEQEKIFFKKIKFELEFILFKMADSHNKTKIKRTLELFSDQFDRCTEGVSGAVHAAYSDWGRSMTFTGMASTLRVELADEAAVFAKLDAKVSESFNVHIDTNLASRLVRSGYEVPYNDSRDPHMGATHPYMRHVEAAQNRALVSYNTEKYLDKVEKETLKIYERLDSLRQQLEFFTKNGLEDLPNRCDRIFLLGDDEKIARYNPLGRPTIYVTGRTAYWYEGEDEKAKPHPISNENRSDILRLMEPGGTLTSANKNFEIIAPLCGYTLNPKGAYQSYLSIWKEFFELEVIKEGDVVSFKYQYIIRDTFISKFTSLLEDSRLEAQDKESMQQALAAYENRTSEIVDSDDDRYNLYFYQGFLNKMQPLINLNLADEDDLFQENYVKAVNTDLEKNLIENFHVFLQKKLCGKKLELGKRENEFLINLLGQCFPKTDQSAYLFEEYVKVLLRKSDLMVVDIDDYILKFKDQEKMPMLLQACERGEFKIAKRILEHVTIDYYYTGSGRLTATEYIVFNRFNVFSDEQQIELIQLFLSHMPPCDEKVDFSPKLIENLIQLVKNFPEDYQGYLDKILQVKDNVLYIFTLLRSLSPSTFTELSKRISKNNLFMDSTLLSIVYEKNGFLDPAQQIEWVKKVTEQFPVSKRVLLAAAHEKCAFEAFHILFNKIKSNNAEVTIIDEKLISKLIDTKQWLKLEFILIDTNDNEWVVKILEKFQKYQFEEIHHLNNVGKINIKNNNNVPLTIDEIVILSQAQLRGNFEENILMNYFKNLVKDDNYQDLYSLILKLSPSLTMDNEHKSAENCLINWLASLSISDNLAFEKFFLLASETFSYLIKEKRTNQLIKDFAELKSSAPLLKVLIEYPEIELTDVPESGSESNKILINFFISLSKKSLDSAVEFIIEFLKTQKNPHTVFESLLKLVVKRYDYDEEFYNKINAIITEDLKKILNFHYPNRKYRATDLLTKYVVQIENFNDQPKELAVMGIEKTRKKFIRDLKNIYHAKKSSKFDAERDDFFYKIDLIGRIKMSGISCGIPKNIIKILKDEILTINCSSGNICQYFLKEILETNRLYKYKYKYFSLAETKKKYLEYIKFLRLFQNYQNYISEEKDYRNLDNLYEEFLEKFNQNHLIHKKFESPHNFLKNSIKFQKLMILMGDLLKEYENLMSMGSFLEKDIKEIESSVRCTFELFVKYLKPVFLVELDRRRKEFHGKLSKISSKKINSGCFLSGYQSVSYANLSLKYKIILKNIANTPQDIQYWRKEALKEIPENSMIYNSIIKEFDIRLNLFKILEVMVEKCRNLQHYQSSNYRDSLFKNFTTRIQLIINENKISAEEKKHLFENFCKEFSRDIKPPLGFWPSAQSEVAPMDVIFAVFCAELVSAKTVVQVTELKEKYNLEIKDYQRRTVNISVVQVGLYMAKIATQSAQREQEILASSTRFGEVIHFFQKVSLSTRAIVHPLGFYQRVDHEF